MNTESSTSTLVSLTNSGTASLSFKGIALTGSGAANFLAGTDCTSSIAVGVSCNIRIRFYPQSAGATSAVLNIGTNAADSPETITLTGTGD